MRKLRIIEHSSLDGVIQAPAGMLPSGAASLRRSGFVAPHVGKPRALVGRARELTDKGLIQGEQ